ASGPLRGRGERGPRRRRRVARECPAAGRRGAGDVIRVLIADDQALVRGGFRMILDAQPDIEVCAEAGDGREALDAAASANPDVVLIDIRMPDVDGIDATRHLLARPGRAPRVLMLTTFDLDE